MDNLWQRRSNTGKLSLSTSSSATKDSKIDSPRAFPSGKRFGDTSSHGGKNPFNALNTSSPNLSSPGASAFGLGTGAFASFGSSSKVPKTPGASSSATDASKLEALEKDKENKKEKDAKGSKLGGGDTKAVELKEKETAAAKEATLLKAGHTPLPPEHPLKYTWVVWYRPPTNKYTDYEKSTVAIGSFSTVEGFWALYTHLKRPSMLPTVSDYHIFKKGIRPVWEDEENKRGGKWIVRLKKGVADRYWEELLLGIVGDQFMEAGEEVCGAVISMRGQEDVLSVWTRIDGGRNIKIRETVKRLLNFPSDTVIVWKSHDDSIAQRTAIDQARQEKAVNQSSGLQHRRRDTISEDASTEKPR